MPKTKKETINDKKQCTLKTTVPKRQKKTSFKFDIKKILKERRAEGKLLKQSAKFDEEMKVIDELYQEKVNETIDFEDNNKLPLELTNLKKVVIDRSNFNIPFNDNSNADSKKLCIQRFKILSIESNAFQANIHLNHLKKANWSPEFNDVHNILCKWQTDLDTSTSGPSLEYQKVGRHNFDLVINFISHSIFKNKKFSVAELLTIANLIVTISFDHLCGQMMYVIKRLFKVCIETALEEDNDTTIIAFAQEFYSKYNKDDLSNMMVDLFLPLEGKTMKTIYAYITFKLYKSLLGKTDDTSAFPSSIKEWFVQDLVDKSYFNKKKNILCCVIQLLEHVVFVFDLYQEEKKLEEMYEFLNAAVKPTGI